MHVCVLGLGKTSGNECMWTEVSGKLATFLMQKRTTIANCKCIPVPTLLFIYNNFQLYISACSCGTICSGSFISPLAHELRSPLLSPLQEEQIKETKLLYQSEEDQSTGHWVTQIPILLPPGCGDALTQRGLWDFHLLVSLYLCPRW